MRQQKWIFCLGLMALIVGLVPATPSAGATPQQTGADAKSGPTALPAAKEELLGELPPEIKAPVDSHGAEAQYNRFCLSPDRRRFAAMGRTDKKKWAVVIDGKSGPEFEEVRFKGGSRLPGVSPVTFSPNSQRVGYWAHSGENKWVVVVDGQPSSESEFGVVDSYALPSPPTFSPDSQHLAYRARRGPNGVMVVDGKEGPQFSYVGDPLFSPNSHHVAYAARTGGGKTVVLLDGQAGPEYEDVGSGLSGYEMPGYVSADGLFFSSDSQHFAYSAKRGPNKWVMVIDGKEGPEFQWSLVPVFSPDSRHVAYSAQQAQEKRMVVVDGQLGQPFNQVGPGEVFSADGKHLAYKAKRGPNKWVMVLDGEAGPEFEDITKGPFFSPDSRRLTYEVLQGAKSFVVLDGKAGPEFDAVPFPMGKSKGSPQWGSSLGTVFFSPNGQHVSYVARRGQKLVVVQDEQVGPELPFIVAGPIFSSDSQHVVYMGWEKNAISVILDGKTVKKIPISDGRPLYTEPGREATVDRQTVWDATGELAKVPLLWPVLFGGEFFSVLAAKEVNFVEHVSFSGDGQHLAYVLGHGGRTFDGAEGSRARRQLVLDGREDPQYDADAFLNLTFSPHGDHFAAEVHKTDKGQSFVVVDGKEGKPYDELLASRWREGWDVRIASTLRFEGENSITYLAREGRKFYRVTQPLP